MLDANIWQRICAVGGVDTELLGIDAKGSPVLQVVVFPGNPGSAQYFKPFMAALYDRLGGTADVLAVTHAGHDAETEHGGRMWSLQEQIDHKLAFLREHVLLPGRPPVVLVGHSIGACMAVKSVAALEGLRGAPECFPGLVQAQRAGQLPRIVKIVAVFPFFETNFPGNARQRRLRAIAPWYELLGWVGALVTSLPWALTLGFVRLNAAMDPHAQELTARLLVRKTVRQAFYLAGWEFRDLSRPWDWGLLGELGGRLHVMGCEADTWMSREQYDAMCDRVPGLQATWHPDLRHAFCTSHRQSAAAADHIAGLTLTWLDSARAAASVPIAVPTGAVAHVSLAEGHVGVKGGKARGRTDGRTDSLASWGSLQAPAGSMSDSPSAVSVSRAGSSSVTISSSGGGGGGCGGDGSASSAAEAAAMAAQHARHAPHGDQQVPYGQTSVMRTAMYGDDVTGSRRHLTADSDAVRPAALASVDDGDVDQSAATLARHAAAAPAAAGTASAAAAAGGAAKLATEHAAAAASGVALGVTTRSMARRQAAASGR
ncbi:hypothetical protein HYH03_014180 [Edaphochlamys debaryana]|uniref:Lipid droplet-associated hydrolase n=1 Tax=Edaphochlamys debaryana TaxID=47281 RepID=A0A835XS20_9CHLO|nr:hypothetical protein HYH03_014180 [Edaphochlamys debaryana]|eukprot:KAG2487206.1 hypothetical protein HYH03_014180 [Edaphochlamys debaryana]